MAMSNINSRYEYLVEARVLYWRAKKSRDRKKLTSVIDDASEITGLNRKYLITLLRSNARKYSSGFERSDPRGRSSVYSSNEFRDALLLCWRVANGICAERLQPYLYELIPKLESCGEIKITAETKQQLLTASVSTIARKLNKTKRQHLVPLGTTKPGTLLKSQIPMRKGVWSEDQPGYLESDTVAHCAQDLSGQFIHSYNFVDIATSWSEQVAVMGMGERATVTSFGLVRDRLPFEVKGIDSDNGSEYINHHLWRYCKREKIEFTRSRPYKKNDNAHVEQKNYSAIRKTVGYSRLDTLKQEELMNNLYSGPLRLYLNFFQPTRKRKSKEYDPSTGKARKFYFEAKTPYQRILDSEHISDAQKDVLRLQYTKLNPVKLLAEVRALLTKLESSLG